MKKHPTRLVRATWKVLGKANWFSAENQFFLTFSSFEKVLFVALKVRGWCHSCQLLHHSWQQKVQGDENWFSAENQFFLAFSTFEKAFLWHSRWGGWCHSCQVLHLSGLFELTRRPSRCKTWHSWHHPPHLSCHKKAFSKVSKAKKNWFAAENQFSSPWTFCHHSWCKSWHSWHHPLTSRGTKSTFSKV